MEETISLRKAAPQWTLAGDKQLLGILEKLHKKIITHCQETNAKLDLMVDALDDASVNLQNVNNKFMALSNSQFVESRVYDEDVVVVPDNVEKFEPPKTNPENDLQKMKEALKRLSMMHEPVQILYSDSSDEEETSIILKPIDVYSHRPLPYIIGSAAWKSKWHAGLLPEESDSDSSISKHEEPEEYSESEPEAVDVPTDKQRTISTSSSLPSEEPQAPQKPADIAAELARRLAGPPLKLPAQAELVEEPPEPATRKVYRVEKPAPATVFSDEPPPLDTMESEYSDDDIFAELHKKPSLPKISQYNDIVDDLFGVNFNDDGFGNLVDDSDDKPHTSTHTREKSPLFDEGYAKSVLEEPVKTINTDVNIKKPIGGISLFGSNKGAENIGAAILKRNQRKSSTTDEESDVIETKLPETIKKEPTDNNKKLIEDLFAKPVTKKKDIKNKAVVKPVIDKPKPVETKPKSVEKVDLFSDNIFDDIDDIFTTNVITKPKMDNNTKSIFDDDDDLFSEVAQKPEKAIKNTKSIFDSDDDLFKENEASHPITKQITKVSTNPVNVDTSDIVADKIVKTKENKVKSVFDDESDDDDLFANVKLSKSEPKPSDIKEKISFSDESNKNLSSINKTSEQNTLNVANNKVVNKTNESQLLQSPNLFDDEDYDLFNTKNAERESLKSENNVINNESKNEVETEPSLDEFAKSIISDGTSEQVETVKHRPSSFNKDMTEEENAKATNKVSHKIEKVMEKEQNAFESEDNTSKEDFNNKTFENKSNTQEEPKFDEPDPSTTNEDIFSDVFADLPPEFEKPSEPKKSKNVNALFDDDSDDETLFFKKNDPISDEKPDVNFNSDRFRIFHDEPPDIDVDFAQKPLKINAKQNSIFEDENDENFENETGKPIEYVLPQDLDDLNSKSVLNNESVVTKSSDNNSCTIVDIHKLLEEEKEDYNTDKEIPQTEDENKKPIGKLKPMNFNIDVNSLLPGASLKKNKEETDGQTISASNEELHVQAKSESKMAKSVSFDGNTESGVLDNKLSKERAKIQVKRRPSSRRARLEAVRKSGIEFGSDSTDNSSFDETKPRLEKDGTKSEVLKTDDKIIKSKVVYILNDEDIFSTNTKSEETSKKPNIDDDQLFKSSANINNAKSDKKVLNIVDDDDDHLFKSAISTNNSEKPNRVLDIVEDDDLFKSSVNTEDAKPNKKVLNIVDDDDDHLFKSSINPDKDKPNKKVLNTVDDKNLFKSSVNTDNKEKPNKSVLNIIDDDDNNLFKSSMNTDNEKSKKVLDMVDDDDELFKLPAKKDNKQTKLPKDDAKQSLFGDSDDDELFSNKKVEKVKKSNLFDSGSEDELFNNKKKEKEKKVIAKGPLFDDESGDDDLFGTKSRKLAGKKPETTKMQSTTTITAEPVFDDPLSMLGDDDS